MAGNRRSASTAIRHELSPQRWRSRRHGRRVPLLPGFRYQAKAPASERPRLEDGTAHETVKPLGFISWAVRLITPPGGTVLDMFAGAAR